MALLGVIAQNGRVTVADDLQVRPPGSGEVSVKVRPLAEAEAALRALQDGDVVRVVVDLSGLG